jgi:NAD(P)-dependent dehydrogenase (short-subunit alcohol dehydrogenase family)
MIAEGRVALVTGGGSGIGREIALRLAKSGIKVGVVDINKTNIDEVVNAIESMGQEAMALECDVTSKESCFGVAQGIINHWGRIDILVNSAGILYDTSLKKLTEDNWDRVHNVCLKGTLFTIQAVQEIMTKQGYGRIVNIASAAYLGNAYQAAYATAKAGVVSLTKVTALELARHGITANCVAPGLIDTPMTQTMPAEAKEKLTKSIPLGRLGTPGDIAHVVMGLVADDASYITGQIIIIDGGVTTGMMRS